MTDNPFEDKESLFKELMEQGKKPLRQEGISPFKIEQGTPELGSGDGAIPLDGFNLDEEDMERLKAAVESEDVGTILGILSMEESTIKKIGMAAELIDALSMAAKMHSAILIVQPEHEDTCGITSGIVPDNTEEYDWTEMHGDVFNIVEANILGFFMMLRTELVQGGIELDVYPTFPDVPAFAFSGQPPEGMEKVNLDTCDVCGEYVLLCECGKDES